MDRFKAKTPVNIDGLEFDFHHHFDRSIVAHFISELQNGYNNFIGDDITFVSLYECHNLQSAQESPDNDHIYLKIDDPIHI